MYKFKVYFKHLAQAEVEETFEIEAIDKQHAKDIVKIILEEYKNPHDVKIVQSKKIWIL